MPSPGNALSVAAPPVMVGIQPTLGQMLQDLGSLPSLCMLQELTGVMMVMMEMMSLVLAPHIGLGLVVGEIGFLVMMVMVKEIGHPMGRHTQAQPPGTTLGIHKVSLDHHKVDSQGTQVMGNPHNITLPPMHLKELLVEHIVLVLEQGVVEEETVMMVMVEDHPEGSLIILIEGLQGGHDAPPL